MCVDVVGVIDALFLDIEWLVGAHSLDFVTSQILGCTGRLQARLN